MRLELTRRSDLALRALQRLHARTGRVKSATLASEVGTTPSFLPQVMGPLVKEGWVDSAPGPRGGYRLVAAPGTISVLDLLEAVEGVPDAGQCVLRDGACTPEPCALHEPWAQARAALLRELSATPVVARPSSKRSSA